MLSKVPSHEQRGERASIRMARAGVPNARVEAAHGRGTRRPAPSRVEPRREHACIAPRLPSTHTTTMPDAPRAPAGRAEHGRAHLRHERLARRRRLDRHQPHERGGHQDVDAASRPQNAQRERTRHGPRGSRTSPAILVTSHQPPNEKNADTSAPASAPRSRGGAPARRATNGTKWPSLAAGAADPHATSATSSPILSSASAWPYRRPIAHARHVHRRDQRDRGDRRGRPGRVRHEARRVAGEARGEGGRDARVHHQQALPAVEEGRPAARTPRAGRRSRRRPAASARRARRSRARRTAAMPPIASHTSEQPARARPASG